MLHFTQPNCFPVFHKPFPLSWSIHGKKHVCHRMCIDWNETQCDLNLNLTTCSGTRTLKLCMHGEPGIFSHVKITKGREIVWVVSNRWTGFWTGLLDWIAGLDSEERCQTSMQDCMCSEDLCLARSYGRS